MENASAYSRSESLRSPRLRPENMVHQTKKTSRHRAAKASIRISHMRRQGFGRRAFALAVILGTVAGCAGLPGLQAPAPIEDRPAVPAPVAVPVSPVAAEAPPPAPVLRPRSRWVPAGWDELPGWGDDRIAEVWPALTAGCARPAPGW